MIQPNASNFPPGRRTNTHLARIVDIGLGYKAGLGYPQAKLFLHEQGVPADIVKRVLSNGGTCRNTDDADAA